MKDYFFLALNSLKRRKLRSWLTMIGIFIGIAAVVSLISLGQGLQNAITSQFDVLSVDRLTVSNAETGFGPPGSTAVEKLNENDLKIINSVQGIEQSVPRLLRISKVEFNNVANFEYITNIPEDSEEMKLTYDTINVDLMEGKLLESGDSGKVFLGNDFASEGLFDKKINVGKSIVIQGKEFEVVGILEKSSTFTVNSVVFMLEQDMRDIFDIDDEIDFIVVKVRNPDDIEKVAEEIEKEIRQDRGLKVGEEDFSVETPSQALESVNTILNVVNIVVSGIAGISLVVGGIGIMNTMYTSVLERKKEIGTMKSIGARNSDITLIFLIESGLLGLVGGVIGAVLGVVLSFAVSFGANAAFNNQILSFNCPLSLFFGAIGFSFLIGLFSGLLPSFQASRLKPVEALRS
jgi:putative ABC transport system permease protein